MRSQTIRRSWPALLAVFALTVAACGDDDAASTATTTSTTTTSTTTTSATDDIDIGAPDGVVDADGNADVNAESQTRLDEATGLWAGQAGLDYVWGYREEGEGETLEFCHEAVAGELSGRDAAACPFSHELGSQSVDAWLETIQIVLDNAPETGREVTAFFDLEFGYPTSVEFGGGEVDGLLFTVVNFDPQGPVEAGDRTSNLSLCESGSVAGCYDLGQSGEAPPTSWESDGNSYSQAPTESLEDDCNSGDEHACYWLGVRDSENSND